MDQRLEDAVEFEKLWIIHLQRNEQHLKCLKQPYLTKLALLLVQIWNKLLQHVPSI